MAEIKERCGRIGFIMQRTVPAGGARRDWMLIRNLTEYWTGLASVSQVLGHQRPACSVANFCAANR